MRVSTPRTFTLDLVWVALGTLADLCSVELLPCCYPENLLLHLAHARKRVRVLLMDQSFDWDCQLAGLGCHYVTPTTLANALEVLACVSHGKHYADLDGARAAIVACCLTPNAQVLV